MSSLLSIVCIEETVLPPWQTAQVDDDDCSAASNRLGLGEPPEGSVNILLLLACPRCATAEHAPVNLLAGSDFILAARASIKDPYLKLSTRNDTPLREKLQESLRT